MNDSDEDEFDIIVKTVNDIVMDHPSITFDVTIAERLKLRNFYLVIVSLLMKPFMIIQLRNVYVDATTNFR